MVDPGGVGEVAVPVQWSLAGQRGPYRCGGAWWDVEEGHPVLGAFWDGEVLRNGVKGLQVNQHLICLVDAERQGASFCSGGYTRAAAAGTQRALLPGERVFVPGRYLSTAAGVRVSDRSGTIKGSAKRQK